MKTQETVAVFYNSDKWHDISPNGDGNSHAVCQKEGGANAGNDDTNEDGDGGGGETCSITYYTTPGDACTNLKCDSANPQKRCCPGGPDEASPATYANGDPNAWQTVRPIPPAFNRL